MRPGSCADRSVVDACFWDQLHAHQATNLAGVPYTFDLLDRIGFEDMSVPSLRFVSQAGGRLAPARVQRYAELGERNGSTSSTCPRSSPMTSAPTDIVWIFAIGWVAAEARSAPSRALLSAVILATPSPTMRSASADGCVSARRRWEAPPRSGPRWCS